MRTGPSARRSASASGDGRNAERGRARAERGGADVDGAVAVAVGLDDRPELGAVERAEQPRARCGGSRRGRRSARSGHYRGCTVGSFAPAPTRTFVPSRLAFAATHSRKLRGRAAARRDEQARPQARELVRGEDDVAAHAARIRASRRTVRGGCVRAAGARRGADQPDELREG